jgi:hypothetical protein
MDEKISFSGGEIRSSSAAVSGTAVWNRDPLPPPPPPKTYIYKLTVRQYFTSTDPNSYDAVATATSMEVLVAFELQMRALGYEFIKLERLDE